MVITTIKTLTLVGYSWGGLRWWYEFFTLKCIQHFLSLWVYFFPLNFFSCWFPSSLLSLSAFSFKLFIYFFIFYPYSIIFCFLLHLIYCPVIRGIPPSFFVSHFIFDTVFFSIMRSNTEILNRIIFHMTFLYVFLCNSLLYSVLFCIYFWCLNWMSCM